MVRFHDGRRGHEESSISIRSPLTVAYFERELESFAKRRLVFLVGARTSGGHGEQDLFLAVTLSLSLLAASFAVFSILRLFSFVYCPTLSLFLFASAYALLDPPRLSYLRDSPWWVSVRRSLSGV